MAQSSPWRTPILSFLLGLASLACSPRVHAQTPRLVIDLNPAVGAPSLPRISELLATDDALYFGSDRWLYRTDGTNTGTFPVHELQNNQGGPPRFLRALGSGLFFTDQFRDLPWFCDGVADHTRLLSPFNTNDISNARSIGGFVYYRKVGHIPHDIWRTDGTPEGTVRLCQAESLQLDFVPLGSRAIFLGSTQGAAEIWISDGTVAGTHSILPLATGNPLFGAFRTVELNGVVLFANNLPDTGTELWRSDGTAEGTYLVKDINPGDASSTPSSLTLMNGIAYFFANDGAHGHELWRTDGTRDGTYLVKDIMTGSQTSVHVNETDFPMVALDNRLIFRAMFPSVGEELAVSDGTEAGTTFVADVSAGTRSSSPRQFIRLGDQIIFNAETLTAGRELWRTDGTAAGTAILKDIWPGVQSGLGDPIIRPVVFRDRLYFWGAAAPTGYLFSSDGTTDGTQPVYPTQTTAAAGTFPTPILDFHGDLIFVNSVGPSATTGLWRTHGDAASTVRLTSRRPGQSAALLGTDSFIFANDGNTNSEPWKSDGTPAGTVQITEINPSGNGSPGEFLSLGSTALFFGTTPAAGSELWRTDGDAAGTFMLADMTPGPLSTPPIAFPFTPGTALVTNLSRLYRTDGTIANTTLIHDFWADAYNTTYAFTRVGERYFFPASYRPTSGPWYVWVTDGTPDGTYALNQEGMPAISNPAGSIGSFGAVIGDVLYFTGYIDGPDPECGLYRTDGTPQGTYQVDIPFPLCPAQLVASGGRVFFTAWSEQAGDELWVSDGTGPGTFQVLDIYPGLEGSAPKSLTPFRNKLYFTAHTPGAGWELWVSDGTPAGTRMVSDLWPGARGSAVESLYGMGNRLFLTAATPASGMELFVIEFSPADIDDSGSVNSADFFLYLQQWFAGDPAADFDGSGLINSADFFAFLDEFFNA